MVEFGTSKDPISDGVAVVLDTEAVVPVPIERIDVEFHPDSRRVIVKPYLPEQQILPNDGLLARESSLYPRGR
jgi:hypothetical protein